MRHFLGSTRPTTINLAPMPGSIIGSCAEEAIRIAAELDVDVSFTLDGVDILVSGRSHTIDVIEIYWDRVKGKRITETLVDDIVLNTRVR